MNWCKLSSEKTKWIGLVCLILSFKIVYADSPLLQVESVKHAEVIFNLNKFVKWNNISNINICFVGDNPEILQSLMSYEGKKISNHLVNIKQLAPQNNQLTNCQMVFISESKAEQLAKILNELQNTSVLTVSDIPGFAQQGGMIAIVWMQNRVKFEINLDLIKKADIRVSANLLSLAKIVN